MSLILAMVYGLPLEISDSAPISAPFAKGKKEQPQGPTLTVSGKFGNVTQKPPYHQAQELGSKYNKLTFRSILRVSSQSHVI